jgi:hypothetical protein
MANTVRLSTNWVYGRSRASHPGPATAFVTLFKESVRITEESFATEITIGDIPFHFWRPRVKGGPLLHVEIKRPITGLAFGDTSLDVKWI